MKNGIKLYPEFAKIADEEGFPQIANTFRQIAKVEAEHEKRYRTLLGRVEAGKVFERDEEIEWQCRNCGYVIKSKKGSDEMSWHMNIRKLILSQRKIIINDV